MKIVGCDLHTRYQQVAMLDDETGELIERRLEHANGEAQEFYRKLRAPVRVGIEATGHTRWFERLLAELKYELWIGDAARIRAADVRKQKTDARDAALLLELLLSGRFPRLWRPSREDRDLRQLLWHRQKLVWMRNAVGNQLHALAMGEGICRKKQLFTRKGRAELEALNLDPWASRRRQELLHMLDQTDASLQQFDQAVNEQASRNESAVRLMTHRNRSGDVVGVCADRRSGGPFPAQQTAGELSGTQSAGTLLRRTTEVRRDLETRQSDVARIAGRSRTHRRTLRSGVAAGLSTVKAASWRQRGESRGRQKTGGADVLDATQENQLHAAGSHARQLEGHPGAAVDHRWADWSALPPGMPGV